MTFTVARGERWGILGRNGSGKTTLFRLITGDQQPTTGVVSRQPALRVTLLEQHREFTGAQTVWEAAAGEFAELLALELSLAEQAHKLAEAGEAVTSQMLARYDRDLERFQREDGYSLASRVDAVLDGLGFEPEKARTQPLTQLSGGERGRLGLARQLVSPADVLLLDEPTNHLDLETTRWLEEFLHATDRTVLLISHDRAFIANVVDHILHLEGGTALAYAGDYESFVTQRNERRLSQQRAVEKQRKLIAGEEDYIRRNIAGQNSKQAKGRRKRLSRLPRLTAPSAEQGGVLNLSLDVIERGGDQVAVARGVTIEIDGRTLISDFSATIQRGDIVGFIGPNGSGKSTLLRSLVGDRDTTAGELRIGGSITAAYYRQDLAQVPTDRTLYEIIADLRPLWTRGQIQGHLGRFGFSGEEVQRRADTLSGGEQARVALAMMMLSRANFLMLDEPTNHLDIESVEALEDALGDYEGTVLLVSHDRALLDALASRVWILHDRHITDFHGSFAEWEEQSRERQHAVDVARAEQDALRRLREKKTTQRQHASSDETRANLREARRRVEEVEREISELETRVSELTRLLEDPALYTSRDGTEKSLSAGKELETVRRKLDAAIAKWTDLNEQAEKLAVL
ncbi:MAG TPA: ABC-F family ATP-binding cassette domain-containing protein [Gemmatimonadaceae bacterium]|nr:ABC-F family ATP-binding cassette domain-containing protein [Gemmatimonadaceae bacterium]